MHVIKRRPNASKHREKATKILVFARLAAEKDFPPTMKADQQKKDKRAKYCNKSSRICSWVS